MLGSMLVEGEGTSAGGGGGGGWGRERRRGRRRSDGGGGGEGGGKGGARRREGAAGFPPARGRARIADCFAPEAEMAGVRCMRCIRSTMVPLYHK